MSISAGAACVNRAAPTRRFELWQRDPATLTAQEFDELFPNWRGGVRAIHHALAEYTVQCAVEAERASSEPQSVYGAVNHA